MLLIPQKIVPKTIQRTRIKPKKRVFNFRITANQAKLLVTLTEKFKGNYQKAWKEFFKKYNYQPIKIKY